ncbi:unnamed protein product [Eruca vesicaria subsp. sativa]|uniref:Protein kinase domain-containing protein n=1 Tax=Eruca vesicaria subsp. sativa TaxID=29727 RepID=A0ABC8L417_ERUVS|nr:unnamed protein product [Eruca vesicaria subsp. sativa]
MRPWRRKKVNEPSEWFLKNGSAFLQELISDSNGISNPIRFFSSEQILKATDRFDPNCSISRHRFFTWYKGVIEGRPCTIKKFTDSWFSEENEREVYNDIVYLLGLKIAKEVAVAVTYLHAAFRRIIIHRDINLTNVFLDKNWNAKLTDFTFSVSLPEGKSWIKDKVVGTFGYIDPVYFSRGLVTEYTDVFSFGIFMLALLLGRPAVFAGSDGVHCNILDYVKDLQERGEPVEFVGGSNDMMPGQMRMFLDLALRCCQGRSEDRPKMILVAKEIKLIEKGLLDCSEDGRI